MKPSHDNIPRLLLFFGLTLAAGGLAAACADDGNPWAEVLQVQLESSLADDLSTDESVVFRTRNNYIVELTDLSLEVGELEVVMSEGGADGLTFDPNDPPPGFTTCHAGHCHLVENPAIIVSYEEIEEMLRTEGVDASFSLQISFGGAAAALFQPLLGTDRAIFDQCEAGCWLERGSLASLDALVSRVTLSARITDDSPSARSGNPRLPESGIVLRNAAITAPFFVRGPLDGQVGKGEDLYFDIGGELLVPDTLFDGVDFQRVYTSQHPATEPAPQSDTSEPTEPAPQSDTSEPTESAPQSDTSEPTESAPQSDTSEPSTPVAVDMDEELESELAQRFETQLVIEAHVSTSR